MSKETPQTELWSGDFGREYVARNFFSPAELDEMYLGRSSVSRSELNERFIGGLDRDLRILEVGANVGNQLRALAGMGFRNLYGIELNSFAVEKAKELTKGINLIQGSAYDIPFKDGFFDLVFTSGVLIHLSPSDLPTALAEIHRCSARYIWGYESWASELTDVNYRGNQNLMWKGDYSKNYLAQFSDLTLLKEELVPYKDNVLNDCMFLLEKKS